jgi:hypothetical protein
MEQQASLTILHLEHFTESSVTERLAFEPPLLFIEENLDVKVTPSVSSTD